MVEAVSEVLATYTSVNGITVSLEWNDCPEVNHSVCGTTRLYFELSVKSWATYGFSADTGVLVILVLPKSP